MNPVQGFTMLRFLDWLSRHHPEIRSIEDESIDHLLALVDEFEGGALRGNRELSRKWREGFRVLLKTDSDWQGYGQARSRWKNLSLPLRPRRRPDNRRRDQVHRYRHVPLHAIFLYSSEDPVLASYITDNWSALDRLSADLCDIHPSLDQLAGQEDAYVAVGLLSDIIGYIRSSELPGMAFWDNDGQVAYIPFHGWDADSVRDGLRFIFESIRTDPSIPSVLSAQKAVRAFVSERNAAESHPVFNQNVYGGTAGQAMHLTQRDLEPGDPDSLLWQLVTHADQLPPAVRRDFLSDIGFFRDSGLALQYRLSAGLRITASLSSAGNQAAARAVTAELEKLVGPTVED
ncbi:hypothetical protein [Streptomyces sp. NPDC058401]|uniref:hypothetical protein n=1 Tax=Streptomyces sp. NPDC058401 TaxID=3346480 RepID=UPI0036647A23